MKTARFWIPIIASLIATPICLFLGFASGGAGHGDYILATILFPYSVLLIFTLGLVIPSFITATLMIVQFPVYGIILGFATKRRRMRSWAIILLIVHVLGVIAGLSLRSRFM
jgi:hypothetical protein